MTKNNKSVKANKLQVGMQIDAFGKICTIAKIEKFVIKYFGTQYAIYTSTSRMFYLSPLSRQEIL